MSVSRKYGRTYHYPFSPGTTSDDRINHSFWNDIQKITSVVHTEKLDGENTCLNQYGVFARSHAVPTRHPWANYLKEKWSWLKRDLGDLEVFGENLYAIHSIEYPNLEDHFFVFGIREKDQWLSWEETEFYANLMDFKTVPVIGKEKPEDKQAYEEKIIEFTNQSSAFGSIDVATQQPSKMEGIVTRNSYNFEVETFKYNVFKYVRKNHVKTDQHWSRNWKRATLKWEKNVENKSNI